MPNSAKLSYDRQTGYAVHRAVKLGDNGCVKIKIPTHPEHPKTLVEQLNWTPDVLGYVKHSDHVERIRGNRRPVHVSVHFDVH